MVKLSLGGDFEAAQRGLRVVTHRVTQKGRVCVKSLSRIKPPLFLLVASKARDFGTHRESGFRKMRRGSGIEPRAVGREKVAYTQGLPLNERYHKEGIESEIRRG